MPLPSVHVKAAGTSVTARGVTSVTIECNTLGLSAQPHSANIPPSQAMWEKALGLIQEILGQIPPADRVKVVEAIVKEHYGASPPVPSGSLITQSGGSESTNTQSCRTPPPTPSEHSRIRTASRLNHPVSPSPRSNELPDEDMDTPGYAPMQDPRPVVAGKFVNFKGNGYDRRYASSKWGTGSEAYKLPLLNSAIGFDISGRYINPSKVDPLKLSAMPARADSDMYHLQVAADDTLALQDAICISPIYTEASSVINPCPATRGDLQWKYLSGVLHPDEWERMTATLCTAFNKVANITKLRADIRSGNILSFVTRPVDTRNIGSTLPRQEQHTLLGADEIPVYDARGNSTLHFTPECLDKLINDTSSLPRFRREIRSGSCVIVGYTVGYYYKEFKRSEFHWKIYANIQWVVLLGDNFEKDK